MCPTADVRIHVESVVHSELMVTLVKDGYTELVYLGNILLEPEPTSTARELLEVIEKVLGGLRAVSVPFELE